MKVAAFLFVWIWLSVSVSMAVAGDADADHVGAPVTVAPQQVNSSHVVSNSSAPHQNNPNVTMSGVDLNGSMIQRALYVLIGITIIGMLYFLVRAVRLKKTTQRKKYGLLSNYDDTVEMGQLESDEDDMTVYEAKSLRR